MLDALNVVGRVCVIGNGGIATNGENICAITEKSNKNGPSPKRYMDEAFPVSFHKKRHLTAVTPTIGNDGNATKTTSKTWRIRDRVSFDKIYNTLRFA